MTDARYTRQVALLLQLLPLIAERKEFALKGGTAINLFVRDMPRLSVDIDLTYLPLQTREDSLIGISAGVTAIAKRLATIVPKGRIKAIPGPDTGTATSLVIDTGQALVRVEVNYVIRGTVFPCVTGTVCDAAQEEFGVYLEAPILSFADLFGGKLCAALDRQHPRDLFDVKLLRENEGITAEVRQAFVVYLASHSRPMNELLNPTLLDTRNVFLNEFQGMSRVAITYEELEHVRFQMIQSLKKELSENERRFLLSIKQGAPQWHLLPLSGIDRLPAIQWKIQNIKRMEKTRHAEQLQKLRECLEVH